MSHLPLKSFIIISVVIIVFLFDDLTISLVYERDAILRGEFWRFFTCHIVHFSVWHASLNIIVFAFTGWIIEKKGYPGYGLLVFVMSFGVGVSLILFEPDMQFYGGLSGIAHGALIYLALFGLEDSKSWRDFSRLILVLVLIKAVVELYMESSLTYADMRFRPVPLSHMTGIIMAIMQFYILKLIVYKHRIRELK